MLNRRGNRQSSEEGATLGSLIAALGKDGVIAGFEAFLKTKSVKMKSIQEVSLYAQELGLRNSEVARLESICLGLDQPTAVRSAVSERVIERMLLLHDLGMAKTQFEATRTLHTLGFVTQPHLPNPKPAAAKNIEYHWLVGTSKTQRAALNFNDDLVRIKSKDPAEVTEILLNRAAEHGAELEGVVGVFDMVEPEQLTAIKTRYAELLEQKEREQDTP